MPGSSPLRSWLIALALSVGAVLFCIAYVDHPVADWVQATMHPTALYRGIERALEPLRAVGAALFLFFLAAGAWALSGRPLPLWTKTPLLCSWAVSWALSVTVILKTVFGRAEPDPTYVGGRADEFHWLHGKPDYLAFPSGTIALTSAAVAVLWIVEPRYRAGTSACLLVLAVALVITNSHWVADVIGGAFLGVSIGWMTVRLRPERA